MENVKTIGHVCLTLKEGAVVKIGDDVEVEIVRVGGSGIGIATRIRITAPIVKKIYRVKKNVEKRSEPGLSGECVGTLPEGTRNDIGLRKEDL